MLAHEITGGGSVPWRRRSKPDEVDAEVSKPQQNVRESFGLPRVIQLIRSEAQESPSRDEKAEEERKGCC